MQKKIHHNFILPDEYANERLDQTLAKLLPEYSRTQIQQWILEGAITVNHAPTKPKNKIKGGEEIILDTTLMAEPKWTPQAIDLNIVFEDDEIIVINKPVGLVVHPGAGNQDSTLLNALIHHTPALKLLPRAGIVHRLDKDTSGLLVIAKTSSALQHLTAQIKERSMVREYQAVVYGNMISGGLVDAPIGRHHLQRKKMAVNDDGRRAVTHYRIAEKFRAHTRLKLQLETGRTHQIRVHMAHISHPIVGDLVYGGRVRLSKGMSDEMIAFLRHYKRQALHAFALGLVHPKTQAFMRWEVNLPEDMQQLLTLLREDTERNKQ